MWLLYTFNCVFEGLKTSKDELLSKLWISCVLLLVCPVVKWDRVSPGVTDTTVSWIVQANLTLNLPCQVTTGPVRTTEVVTSGLTKIFIQLN